MKVVKYKKSIAFVLIGVILLSICNLPFVKYKKYGYLYPSNMVKIDYLEEHTLTVEGYVVGDSVAWAGIDPEVSEKEGVRLYNAATPGQNTFDSFVMVENILKRQKPKFIVLETSGFFAIRNPLKHAVCAFLPCIHYHNIFEAKYSFDTVTAKDGGFNRSEAVQVFTGNVNYMQQRSRMVFIDPLSVYYLKKIQTVCKNNDVKLYVTTLPNPLHFTMQKKDILQKYLSDTPYLEMNEHLADMQFDLNSGFRDAGEHCNTNGAKVVTEYLCQWIQGGAR